MSIAPTIEIDPEAFWEDPYPMLARMRSEAGPANRRWQVSWRSAVVASNKLRDDP